jgi:SOS-response transcriptional repressor LexA
MEVSINNSQKKILEYIAKCIDRTGCQPSYRDICKAMGWSSPNMPAQCIDKLAEKGVVKKHGARSVEFDWRAYIK